MDLGSLRRFLPGGRSKPPSEAAPAVESGAAPTDRPAVPAWRRLPGLTPTIGPAPLVARSRGYEQELAGGRGTPLALQRLAHDRGLDAPRGLVVAATAPAARLPAEPMPATARRGRRRRTAGVPVVARMASDDWSPADAAVQADADPTFAVDGADGSSASEEPHVDPLPPAAAPAPGVSRAAAIAAAAGPVRHAATDTLPPAAVVARQVETAPSLTRSLPVSGGPPGIVGERAVGMARSLPADAGAPDVARSAAVVGPRADGSGAVVQPAAARDIGSSGSSTLSRTVAPPTSMSGPRSPTAAPRSEQSSAELPVTISRSVGRVRRVRFDAPIGAPIHPTDEPGRRTDQPAATPVIAREVDATAPSAAGPPAEGDSAPATLSVPSSAWPADVAAAAAAAPSAPSAPSPMGVAAAVAAPPTVPIRPIVARAVDQGTGPLVGTLRPAIDPRSPAVAVGRSTGLMADEAPAEPGRPSAALAALSRIDPYGALGGGFGPGLAPTSPGSPGFGSAAVPAIQRSMPHPAVVATATTAGRPAGVGPAETDLPDPGSTATFGPVPAVGMPGEQARLERFEPGGMRGSVVARSPEAPNRGLPSAFTGRPTVLRLAPANRANAATTGPSVGAVGRSDGSMGHAGGPSGSMGHAGGPSGSMGPSSGAVGSVTGVGSVRSVGPVRSVGSVTGVEQASSASPRGSVTPPVFSSNIPTIQGSFATPDGVAAGTSWATVDGSGSEVPAAGPDAFGSTIQRSLEGSAPSFSADVQRAPADAAPAASAGGGAVGAGTSARELDELAKKLYEPLRRRLHREFIVDRERDGSLLNLGR